MAENLVIVESPAKAKTIEKFLGTNFKVLSSYGHIRDLVSKDLGVDVNNNFEPKYEITTDKKKLVTDLKAAVKSSKMVWLASDEDREGEAISWHLAEVLKLNDKNSKRICFHEITKTAILAAIESPRGINKDLVDAQQARRILDRLVGFELSPILWKKVKPSLSAGRVQSVVVRIIVDREREIINFKSESSYKVSAIFSVPTANGTIYNLKAELSKRLKTKEEALALLEKCKNVSFPVSDIEIKPAKKSPAAPFTTSTLQQEASRKMGFSVAKTMQVAQSLYESGHITYMRTDSVNLSDLAIATAKQEIEKNFGKEYSKVRKFATSSKGAQEAHEAIRPTYMSNASVSNNFDEQRLYELIWKRTLASQMSDAILEKTTVNISIPNVSDSYFVARGEVIKFEGFLKVYIESTDDENDESSDAVIPPIKKGDILQKQTISAIQRYSQHPPRYSEASLVRTLEELGIGRPSTYAPTISTVQKRGYVLKEERPGEQRGYIQIILDKEKISESAKTEVFGAEKNKLFPTDIGMVVNDFLVKHFAEILDFNFTANVEKDFDEIATGQVDWTKMLGKFYKSFHQIVEQTSEHSEKNSGERILGIDPKTGHEISVRIGRFGPMIQVKNLTNADEKPQYGSIPKGILIETMTLESALKVLDISNEGKVLGIDPNTGKEISIRNGRFGPFAQLGSNNDTEKPQYASLAKGQTVDSVTLAQAIELFKLPRAIGEYEDKKVTVGVGRFGPYISHNSVFTPLKKTDDPYTVTLDRAIELIEEKKIKDIEKTIKVFDEDKNIKVVLDRWKNPTVYYKKKYHKIPKGKKPEELTLAECMEIAGVDTTKKKATKAKK